MKKRTFRHGRLSVQVIDEIQRMIVEEYPVSGSRLPREADLADRFQVSRIVVREAMKVLEDRGVVEVKAGRGTLTLAPNPSRAIRELTRLFHDQPFPTIDEMEQLLELRQVLEETTASLAAVRATDEDLREIETALEEMKGNQAEVDKTIAADLKFHRAVMKAAHNRYFEMVLSPLMSVYLQQIKLTNTLATGFDAHHNVFVQIRDRNSVGARQAVRRLIKITLDDSRRALKNKSKFESKPAENAGALSDSDANRSKATPKMERASTVSR
jgi:GntR family transcriptional regulator, galactonate operon transcriptional repressor